MIVGIRGTLDLGQRMFLQLLHDDLDRFIELGVVTLSPRRGIEIDLDVGGDTAVLHFPFAVQSVDRGARSGHAATIDQFGISADTDESSPCPFADQSGPMPALRKYHGKASPPEPDISLMIITFGP